MGQLFTKLTTELPTPKEVVVQRISFYAMICAFMRLCARDTISTYNSEEILHI